MRENCKHETLEKCDTVVKRQIEKFCSRAPRGETIKFWFRYVPTLRTTDRSVPPADTRRLSCGPRTVKSNSDEKK